MLGDLLTKGRLGRLLAPVRDRLSGVTVPQEAAAQPDSIGKFLPYEDAIEHEGCTVVVLEDGSVGVAWSLTPLGHEILTASQLSAQMEALVQALEAVATERVTFQIIWDSSPSSRFAVPDYAAEPASYAQRIMAARIETMRAFAQKPERDLRCMRRQVWLTMRYQRQKRLGVDDKGFGVLGGTATAELQELRETFDRDLRDLREIVTLLEEGLSTAGVSAERLDAAAFVQIVRTGHHSVAARERGWTEYSPAENLRAQCALEFTTFAPGAIQVGDDAPDTLQVLSWGTKSAQAFDGMMAYLLRMQEPLRMVMTLRLCSDLSDLATKEFMLKFAMDAVGKRQRDDITQAQTRIAHNEKAFWVGLHLVVRNTNCSLADVRKRNGGQMVANRLKQILKIPFIVETHAAPLIYRQCVPLGYTPRSGVYTLRERRVLTEELAAYPPVFAGFSGTESKVQLMLSRAGEPIYISSRDCETSPHMAVLASSGGGKSFFQANHLCAARAADPRSLDFIIDVRTSYEVLATLFGEEGGFVLSKPPATFPNVFLGALDDERKAILVNLLRTAITLASPSAELTAEHSMIIGEAITQTFEANFVDARTVFNEGELAHRDTGSVLVPRLSDIVDKFVAVCGKQGIPLEQAAWLRGKLGPFYGTGPYARMFDAKCVAPTEETTPAVTLIDLEGVRNDPIMRTLTALIAISDIIRQIKRPENAGRSGRLTIEEAGVLGDKSPELASFVDEAWKTFRKLKYTCIGLTNEVDDFRKKPAARTMWQVSPTKVILPMLRDELAKAKTEDRVNGLPRLFESDHVVTLVGSLRKVDGRSSQGLWLSETAGTFTYAPTGFDYWLAASKPEEVQTVHRLAAAIGGPERYWRAVAWLAVHKPFGFRVNRKAVRAITDDELAAAVTEIASADVEEEAA